MTFCCILKSYLEKIIAAIESISCGSGEEMLAAVQEMNEKLETNNNYLKKILLNLNCGSDLDED